MATNALPSASELWFARYTKARAELSNEEQAELVRLIHHGLLPAIGEDRQVDESVWRPGWDRIGAFLGIGPRP
jgi:hypothetical protein